MPLVSAEVDIEQNHDTSLSSDFCREEGRASAWLLAQSCTANQECATAGNGGCQNIIDGQRDIGTVVAIVCQREAVRWLYTKYYCARTTLFLTWDKARF